MSWCLLEHRDNFTFSNGPVFRDVMKPVLVLTLSSIKLIRITKSNFQLTYNHIYVFYNLHFGVSCVVFPRGFATGN